MTLKSRVSPFGNLRIKVCSQLPEAYRSVLRPSSPLNAKASTKRPFHTLLNSQTFFIHKYKKEEILIFQYLLIIHMSKNTHLVMLVEADGIEPTTYSLQSYRSPNWATPPCNWWAREDLNLRPHAYQACALTNWATSPFGNFNKGMWRWWTWYSRF